MRKPRQVEDENQTSSFSFLFDHRYVRLFRLGNVWICIWEFQLQNFNWKLASYNDKSDKKVNNEKELNYRVQRAVLKTGNINSHGKRCLLILLCFKHARTHRYADIVCLEGKNISVIADFNIALRGTKLTGIGIEFGGRVSRPRENE